MKHLAGILVLICLSFFGCGADGEANDSRSSGGNLSDIADFSVASFTIHFPDSLPLKFAYDFSEPTRLGDAMPKHPGLQLTMKDYKGMGRLITGINGFHNNENGDRYWQFCINGVVAAKGIDEVELKNKDQIAWHFVLYNELPCKKIGE